MERITNKFEYIQYININTVEPVYNGHLRDWPILAVIDRWPFCTGWASEEENSNAHVSNVVMHAENALKPPELRKSISYYPCDEKVTLYNLQVKQITQIIA